MTEKYNVDVTITAGSCSIVATVEAAREDVADVAERLMRIAMGKGESTALFAVTKGEQVGVKLLGPDLKKFHYAMEDVMAERNRQTWKWSLDHDDQATRGQLARAGIAFASHAVSFRDTDQSVYRIKATPPGWPWDRQWWKPTCPRNDLVKAAALIIAEIERLDRAAEKK